MTLVNGDTNSFALAPARLPPKLATAARKKSTLLALGAFTFIAVAVFLFWFNPAQYWFFPFCVFHNLTGLHCPGCGGTRALHQLLHGHVTTALHLNALVVMTLPLVAWQGIRIAVAKFRQPALARSASPAWFWFFLALAVVFSVLRNLPGFAWLAP